MGEEVPVSEWDRVIAKIQGIDSHKIKRVQVDRFEQETVAPSGEYGICRGPESSVVVSWEDTVMTNRER